GGREGRRMGRTGEAILRDVQGVASGFAADRRLRQRRRELVSEDFALLRDAGFLLTGVPVDQGGMWEDVQHSTRPVCDILRALARGDSSVALVSAMHPAVLCFWLASPKAVPQFQSAWDTQRRQLFESAREGAWWGTITSEPGSGGGAPQDGGRRRP